MKSLKFIESLKFEKGLIPVVIQDIEDGEVLMLAYMNKDSLTKTLKSGKTHFWSRSRKKVWLKGETSGHYQKVKEIYFDCDKDSLLIKVKQVKAACHKGYKSCFYRKLSRDAKSTKIVQKKLFKPEEVYGK
jgi:phosphoribosyl-AMP cyclohydrolase